MKRAVACEDFPGLVIRLRELAARDGPCWFKDAAAKAKACLQMLQQDSVAKKKVDRAEELLQAAVRAGRRAATGGAIPPMDVLTLGKHILPALKSWQMNNLQQTQPWLRSMVSEAYRTGQVPSEERIERALEEMMLGVEDESAPKPQGQCSSSHGGGSSSSSSGVKSKVTKAACVVCGACQGATSACSRCKSVWYCTKAHQVGGVM